MLHEPHMDPHKLTLRGSLRTGQIFGFEYLSLEDLDKAISGSHEESTQAFHLCVGLLEAIFERVTSDQPGTVSD